MSSPRLSPDGARLAWITWDHPQMPWDGADLWVADATDSGIADATRIAGSASESVAEPTWTSEGSLLYFSDRNGWWNLYSADHDEPLVRVEAEMTEPAWFLGNRSLDVFDDGRVACKWFRNGVECLAIRENDGLVSTVRTPYTMFRSLTIQGEQVAAIVASPIHAPRVVVIDVSSRDNWTVIRDNGAVTPDWVSVPEPVSYSTTDGETAHGFWYAPHSRDEPAGKAPLIVNCHGGPASHVVPILDLRQQFWTSRGYGYLELNYRGSTGYGRAYRDALRSKWGVADVDDAIRGALHLAELGLVDGSRLAIRGQSAGGWTALCAVAFRDVFATASSTSGVADAVRLAAETHKFEAHYLDALIGPLPEAMELYNARSPVHSAERIKVPLIVFQGAEDTVVPRGQAETIINALRRQGIDHEYHLYEGEGHGFRHARNSIHALEVEAAFFDRVLHHSGPSG